MNKIVLKILDPAECLYNSEHKLYESTIINNFK